ncbi:MAG: acetyl-CoA carboxylase carboxyltransferase subunit beta [Actinomycetota bacterium]|nr:acetyl-CoA carboxylase carboxyltransferase subunit beta [Actinomycetota bacterium]
MVDKFKCEKCSTESDRIDFISNNNVCPVCNKHYYLDAWQKLKIIIDEGSFSELGTDINSYDFLGFTDTKAYGHRIKEAREKTYISEAVIAGSAKINGTCVAIGIMDFGFMGGSMGSVVGERIRILSEYAIKERLPLIIFCSSGGARMQEGIISLMQMAKTVSCIRRLKESGMPYISVINNPTTGGVSASFASTADIIIAEPESLFCFAGPRVVKQTIKKELPSDFGLAERNLRNGQIDMIVNRNEIKDRLSRLIKIFLKA